MILEIVGKQNSSRRAGEDVAQALQREEKIKSATLGVVMHAKASSSVRKCYSQATLQMSNLSKKSHRSGEASGVKSSCDKEE